MTFPPATVKLKQMFSQQFKLGLGIEATYPIFMVSSAKSVTLKGEAKILSFGAVKISIK